jgi:PilZ domain
MNEINDPSERRAFFRVSLGVLGLASLMDQTTQRDSFAVTVVDVAEGGVLLKADTPLDPGMLLRIAFLLPLTSEQLQLDVVVGDEASSVPTADGEFAAHCRFVELPLEALWCIVGYCVATSGNSAQASRLMSLRHPRQAGKLTQQAEPSTRRPAYR